MQESPQNYTNLRKIVSGDIIVKCRYGNDIRRVPINQAPSYDELCLMMYRLFKKDLSGPDNVVLKYTDDEGDLISMTDDTDVNHAISQSSLLKITVFDKQATNDLVKSGFTATENLKTQLGKLRDLLDEMLKSIEQSEQREQQQQTAAPEKIYRQLSTAELAQFLEETQANAGRSPKKTEMQDRKDEQRSAAQRRPSQPQPQPQHQVQPQPHAAAVATQSTMNYPMASNPTSSMPPSGYAIPAQPPTPVTTNYPPGTSSLPQPPPPSTPQIAAYPPPASRPPAPDYTAYRVSAPSAPPSGQYYYPPPRTVHPPQPGQQQQQQPSMTNGNWR